MKKLFFTLIIISSVIFPQNKTEIIKVIGDSLIGRTTNGISFREVIGNVVMTQGDVKVTCKRAIQNLTQNNAELIGDVIVVQDTVTIISEKGYYFGDEKYIYSDTSVSLNDGHVLLTAKKGFYYFNLKKAVFNSNVQLVDSNSVLNSNNLIYYNELQKAVATGNVDISDSTSIIYCDSLIHNRGTQKSHAFSNVKIINPSQRLTIVGEELIDEGENNITRILGHPLLTKIDSNTTNGEDTLFIRANKFEAIEDSTQKLFAIDSVKIIRGDLFSTNSYSVLYRDENRLMTKKLKSDKNLHVLWFTNSQLVGDSLNIYIANNKLDSIEIRNEATILSKNEKYEFRYDQISGDNINLYFKDGSLSKTEVNGKVLSVYFVYENNLPNGLMKSSSNKAEMYFKHNEVTNVSMYEDVQSEYHPENLVLGNELDFTIPTFIIYINKPTRKNLIQGSR